MFSNEDSGAQDAVMIEDDRPVVPSKLLIAASISLWTYLGVAIRIYVSVPATVLPAFLYPQIVGCFIIGFVSSWPGFSRFPLLKAGLSTGLCGSITSFSSFILEVLLLGKINVWNGLVGIFMVIGLSFASFRLGQHLASCTSPSTITKFHIMESRTILVGLVSLSTLVVLIFAFAVDFKRTFALKLIFGPFGTLLRYALSHLNGKHFPIPIGTLSANLLACVVLFALYLTSTVPSVSEVGCAYVGALEVGFCGSLSTISTFILELDTLKLKYSYTYGFISILTSLIVGIVFALCWIAANGSLESKCL